MRFLNFAFLLLSLVFGLAPSVEAQRYYYYAASPTPASPLPANSKLHPSVVDQSLGQDAALPPVTIVTPKAFKNAAGSLPRNTIQALNPDPNAPNGHRFRIITPEVTDSELTLATTPVALEPGSPVHSPADFELSEDWEEMAKLLDGRLRFKTIIEREVDGKVVQEERLHNLSTPENRKILKELILSGEKVEFIVAPAPPRGEPPAPGVPQ